MARTDGQLRSGGHAIAYRAWQLAHTADLLAHGVPNGAWPIGHASTVLANAVIESALSNARGLAYFFTRSGDVHHRQYQTDPSWTHPVIDLARGVEEPVSRYLSHATWGDKGGERHPGVWPTAELAVALVGGLADFVRDLDADLEAMFSPSPMAIQSTVLPRLRSVHTVESDNPTVAKLTRRLHAYLASTMEASEPPPDA